jgi:hypothetical protein
MKNAEETRWQVRVGEESTTAACDAPPTGLQRGFYFLAHGAGGHMDHRNLVRESTIFRSLGLSVVRFNFTYRGTGRKYPDKMPQLMACYEAVVQSAREKFHPAHIFLGGHSMGGRVASMLAAEGFPCDGLVLLAYPLHPPGKTDQLRADHLPRITAPVLCINGTRDNFCRTDVMARVAPTLPASFTHRWIEHADHSFAVRKKDGRDSKEVDGEIATALDTWLKRM